jgi:hypothetical protein
MRFCDYDYPTDTVRRKVMEYFAHDGGPNEMCGSQHAQTYRGKVFKKSIVAPVQLC